MELLTVQETAQRLKLSTYTVREYIRRGELRAAKFGRVWRISEDDLRTFVEERIEGGRADPSGEEGVSRR